MLSCYDILKVPNFSSLEICKKAYRPLIMEWHPDRNKDPRALEITKTINWAWNIVNKEKEKYDRWLRQQLQPVVRVVWSYGWAGTTNNDNSTASGTAGWTTRAF